MSLMAQVIGHRGCAGHAPENTLEGICEAAKLGCEWIEADATLLADGTVVLFHDEQLNRCTNGTGVIWQKTWSEVQNLDAGKGARIPLLSDALKCAMDHGLGFNMELKVHQGEGTDLAKAVQKNLTELAHGEVVVSSFDQRALQAISGVTKAALFDELSTDGLHPDWASVNLWKEKVTADQVARLKEAGKEVYVFTVNNPEEAHRLFEMGVDGVFSDYPDRILGALK